MNIYAEILAWSERTGCPAWQRDALRRLLAGPLGRSDFTELQMQCMSAHVAGMSVPSEPIASDHLPQQGDSTSDVVLSKFHSVENVGALAGGQTLELGALGLNVIYGDNGSGKSSYSRIIKRLCRARGNDFPLEPNVFVDAKVLPTVTVDFADGDKMESVRWSEGGSEPRPAGLSRVWVFDSAAAEAYVRRKIDLPFRPAGLDLLHQLGSACEQVRALIEPEFRKASAEATRLPFQVAPGTKVASLLAGLSENTSVEDVERFATLSEAETARLEQLQSDIARFEAEDPRKEAARLRATSARFALLNQRVVELSEILSDDAIHRLLTLREDLSVKSAAAELASSQIFGDETLPGVGSEVWRELWRTACEYSGVAYSGQSFPVTGDDSRCVLCQQILTDDAKVRLTRFDEFVRNKLSEQVREIATDVEDQVLRLEKCEFRPDEVIIADLRVEDPEVADKADEFFRSVSSRRAIAIQALNAAEIPTLAAFPSGALTALIERLQARSAEVAAQSDLKVQESLKLELLELRARQQLRQGKVQVLAAIANRKLAAHLSKALTDTDTSPVTRKATELSKLAISDTLSAAFARELEALLMPSTRVELKPSGSKGQLFHQVGLYGIKKKVSGVEAILSEGEHRAIALAGFLAEMSLHPGKSAVVFDDPASSFDHLRRDKVAARIVAEAKQRQVIVFTHDIVFLDHLRSHATKDAVAHQFLSVERRGSECGLTEADIPWVSKNLGQRVRALKHRQRGLRRLLEEHGRTSYEAVARDMYGFLREAWERGVEEVLFARTIERFKIKVETSRLRQVDVFESDLQRIERGMTRASAWLRGHDQPITVNEPIPEPEELLADIEELEAWATEVRDRRGKRRT